MHRFHLHYFTFFCIKKVFFINISCTSSVLCETPLRRLVWVQWLNKMENWFPLLAFSAYNEVSGVQSCKVIDSDLVFIGNYKCIYHLYLKGLRAFYSILHWQWMNCRVGEHVEWKYRVWSVFKQTWVDASIGKNPNWKLTNSREQRRDSIWMQIAFEEMKK